MSKHIRKKTIAPVDTSSWMNKLYDHCLVQALRRWDEPRGAYLHRPRGRCSRWVPQYTWSANEGEVKMANGTTKPVAKIEEGDQLVYEGKVVRAQGVLLDANEKAHLAQIWFDAKPCAGTSTHALSGVLFEHRVEAWHAMSVHYRFANQSICRFRTAAKSDYTADLIFEIDVHDAMPGVVELAWFHKFIAAAVTVGHCILDYLTGVLAIDTKYITVSVTRMGSRVTVDWRAFGPRRLHELLRAVRYIEAQVFGVAELAELASRFGVPKIEIDAKIYERSDVATSGPDESNGFRGPWLRPVGAMHSKSGECGWWYRVTPVPLETFRADNAAWLVKESRGAEEAWQAWPDRELDVRFAVRVPESRNPALDQPIEADPRPALKLIELFERDDLLEHIREEHRDKVRAIQRKTRASRIQTSREHELDAGAIEKFVEALDVDVRERGDKWEMDCPRSGCKQRGRKGAIFKDTGVFTCFRCCLGGMSLVALAAELGMSARLPSRKHSSTPLSTMPIGEVPKISYLTDWGSNVQVIERAFDHPQDLWADRWRELEQFKRSKKKRLFIDASDLGSGKTTTVQKFLNEQRVRHRSFVPRDEAKLDYLLTVDDSVTVQGRRLGINCTNEALDEVLDRREPVAKTLCSACPAKADCAYRAQFADLGEHNLVLTHGHAATAHLDVFANEAEIDLVDEDALGTLAQHDDLTAEELDRLRVGFAYDFPVYTETEAAELRDAGYGCLVDGVTLDEAARPSGATPRLEAVIARLQALMVSDSVVSYSLEAGRAGELLDLDLARYLLSDLELRAAIAALDDEDIREHEARRIELQKDWQREIAGCEPKVIGYRYPERCEAEWLQSEQRATALAQGDSTEEFFAWITWMNARLVPIRAKPNPRVHKRPKDIIGRLQRELYAVYYMATTRTNAPLALQAYRTDKAGSWVLRLTTRRAFLLESNKIIHLSSTAVPERLRLLYGQPTSSAKWIVYMGKLRKKERRIVIADKTYSGTGIFGKGAETLRAELLETTDKLIETEVTRTGLPVALIGSSTMINTYLQHRLGKAARDFFMPFKAHERAEKYAELKRLTVPLGFIAGYAGGVAGSNDFAVDDGDHSRFVRALVVLGNIIPNLAEVARDYRGLFAHVRDQPVDWTVTSHIVAFEGTEHDGVVHVAKNVIGYRDPVADAVLFGVYQGELLQIVGRMRGQLADPVDPSLVPTVYMIAGIAIPGWPVDEVISLDDLRVRLGLAVKATKRRGRTSVLSLEEQIRRRWTKYGPVPTMEWLTRGFYGQLKDAWAVTEARKAIQGAGLAWSNALVAVGNRVIAELEGAARPKG